MIQQFANGTPSRRQTLNSYPAPPSVPNRELATSTCRTSARSTRKIVRSFVTFGMATPLLELSVVRRGWKTAPARLHRTRAPRRRQEGGSCFDGIDWRWTVSYHRGQVSTFNPRHHNGGKRWRRKRGHP